MTSQRRSCPAARRSNDPDDERLDEHRHGQLRRAYRLLGVLGQGQGDGVTGDAKANDDPQVALERQLVLVCVVADRYVTLSARIDTRTVTRSGYFVEEAISPRTRVKFTTEARPTAAALR